MSGRLEQYRNVLGLKGQFSLDDLKRHYRVRAMKLHPDHNGSKSAHDQFVFLHEAYEYYLRVFREDDADSAEFQGFNSKKYPKHYHSETWNHKSRQEARRRAAMRAKMKYEQFERKGYPQLLDKIFFAFDILRLIIAIMLLIVFPVFLYNFEGIKGIYIVLAVQTFTFPLWSKAILRFL